MKFTLKLMIGVLFFAVSLQASADRAFAAVNTCNKTILGGSDVFPWTVAEPFPWKTIQGVWKVHNNSDMLFQFRVTNPNKKNRRLLVQVYSRENCVEPLYKVPGVISDTEKDVVRLQIDDKLMKLAWFNTAHLKMNPYQCGEFVMAASIIASDVTNINVPGFSSGRTDVDLPPPGQDDENSTIENFFLKKISNSLEIYCKRKI